MTGAPQGVARVDLEQTAAQYREAQAALDNARDRLRVSVVGAVKSDMSQSEVSRIIGVDRLTIRKWLDREHA